MKKFFTLTLALLASFATGVWAADPDLETTNWGEDDFSTVITNHDGITLGTDITNWSGNFSGTQYIALDGGCDLSAGSIVDYFAISATSVIDSIEVFWATNNGSTKSDKHNIAWGAWTNAANLLKQDVDFIGTTADYNLHKQLDEATWQKIDLSGKDVKAIILTRQLKKAKIGGTVQSNIGDNKTVNILGVRVWLKASKTPVSTVESLTAVSVNSSPISASDLSTLLSNNTVNLTNSYVSAPTVSFNKHTVITYDDSSVKESDTPIDVVAEVVAGKWQAQTTINATTYTVTAVKPSIYKVAYYDGASKLGVEEVEAGQHPTATGIETAKEFYAFQAWQKDAVDIALNAVEGAADDSITLVARYSKVYTQSINIEQTVLGYGTGYDIETAFTTKGISYIDIDALDTLNDLEKKDNRNYAFLGLKIKKATSQISVLVAAGSTLRVKFGNVGAKITVKVGNADPVDKTSEDLSSPYVYTNETEGDIIVRFNSTSTKTVVFKQIMINEEIKDVDLPAPSAYEITLNAGEHGTLAASWEGKTDKKVNVPVDATVTLAVTPESGYKIASVKYNDGEDHVIEPVESVYSFTMPAAAVTVSATFSVATALDNTEAGAKAVKSLKNGVLIIEKNGKKYNIIGAQLR